MNVALGAVIVWVALAMGVPIPLDEPRTLVMDRAVLRHGVAPYADGSPRYGAYIPWRRTIAVACGAPAWIWAHEVVHWLQDLHGVLPGDPDGRERQARALHRLWAAEHPSPPAALAALTECGS